MKNNEAGIVFTQATEEENKYFGKMILNAKPIVIIDDILDIVEPQKNNEKRVINGFIRNIKRKYEKEIVQLDFVCFNGSIRTWFTENVELYNQFFDNKIKKYFIALGFKIKEYSHKKVANIYAVGFCYQWHIDFEKNSKSPTS